MPWSRGPTLSSLSISLDLAWAGLLRVWVSPQKEMTHTCRAEREPLGETCPGSEEKRTGCPRGPRGKGRREGPGPGQCRLLAVPQGQTFQLCGPCLWGYKLGQQMTGGSGQTWFRTGLPGTCQRSVAIKGNSRRRPGPSLPTTRPRQVNKHPGGAHSAPHFMTQRSHFLGTTGQS